MTESEKIIGFLKYASSRMDYLEKVAAMEKQAAGAKELLRLVDLAQKSYKTLGGKGGTFNEFINAAKAGRGVEGFGSAEAKRLSDLTRKSIINRGGVGGFAAKDVVNGPLDYEKAIKAVQDSLYNTMPIAKGAPEAAAKATQNATARIQNSRKFMREASGADYRKYMGLKPSRGMSNKSGVPGVDKLMSIYNTVNEWAKANPLAAAGIGTAGGSAVGGGLGYGLGHSLGSSSALDTANSYYQMREWLRQQQLQGANDSFLSRLANLFGTGELSNMIG